MKSRIYFTIVLLIMIILSCANSNSILKKRTAFETLLNKFQPLDLPIMLRLDDEQLLKNSKAINNKSTDTMFIKPSGNFLTYGYLRDTSNYFTLIYAVIGDGPFFRIATFDKGFDKIEDASIMNSDGCVPGTLCLKCNTVIEIKEDLRIISLDSLNYLYCEGNQSDSIVQRKQLKQILCIGKDGRLKIIE